MLQKQAVPRYGRYGGVRFYGSVDLKAYIVAVTPGDNFTFNHDMSSPSGNR